MQNQALTDRGKGFGFGILLASTLRERQKKLNETRELMLTVMAEDVGIEFDPASMLRVQNPWEFLSEIKEAVSCKSESAGNAFDLACHLIALPGTQKQVGANMTLEAMREIHLRRLTAKVGLQWRVVEGLYRTVKDGITSGEQLHSVWEPTIAHILRVFEGFVSAFLSYSNADKAFARQLMEALTADGIKVWIDEGEIRVGDSLIEKISKAIENSDFVIPIISTVSVKSQWVRKELSLAMTKELSQRRVQILPVLKDRCEIPDFLKDKLYADFSDPEQFSESVSDLMRAISMTEPDGDAKSPRELVSDFLFDFGLHSPTASESPKVPSPAENPIDHSMSEEDIRTMFGVLAAACVRAGLQHTPLPPQIESAVTALETSGSPFDSLGSMLRQMATGDIPESLHKLFNSEVAPYIHEFDGMSSQTSTNNPEIDAALIRIETFLAGNIETERDRADSYARQSQLALLEGELANADAYAHKARDAHEQLQMKPELSRDYAILAYIAGIYGNDMLGKMWEAKLQNLNSEPPPPELNQWLTAVARACSPMEQLIEPALNLAWLARACLRVPSGNPLPGHAEVVVTFLEAAGPPLQTLGGLLRNLTKAKLPEDVPDEMPAIFVPVISCLVKINIGPLPA